MGDRAMAEIRVKDGSLFFYTHWGGSRLPMAAEAALEKAQPRLGDDAYALKIVVDGLIREVGGRDEATGGGLMLKPMAEDSYNEDKPSVMIDLVNNRLWVYGLHVQERKES